MSAGELSPAPRIKHRPTSRANYLDPALAAGCIEYKLPDKPNGWFQKYRLTEKGRQALQRTRAAGNDTPEDVLTKAKAAAQWCAHATAHEKQHGGKPWAYRLIPHDAIADNKTLQGLAATYNKVC